MGKLLREAWITGSLEHPNIVPVYDLGLDERGAPMLVLKRISGVSWHHLLQDAELVRERFGSADPLEWHLRTLMQVCSAIHLKIPTLSSTLEPASMPPDALRIRTGGNAGVSSRSASFRS